MREHTLEWVSKAEEDFAVAEWVMKAPVGSPSAVGFHCQQCIEKYMKAILVESQLDVPRTHDLTLLANLLAPVVAFDNEARGSLRTMTAFAVENRYPGFAVCAADAVEALHACRMLRRHLRRTMGLAEAS